VVADQDVAPGNAAKTTFLTRIPRGATTTCKFIRSGSLSPRSQDKDHEHDHYHYYNQAKRRSMQLNHLSTSSDGELETSAGAARVRASGR